MWRILLVTMYNWLWYSPQLQIPKISQQDSLLQIIQQGQADTTTVNACYAYGLSILPNQVHKSEEAFNHAYTLSKKLNYRKGIADFASYNMYILDVRGEYLRSLKQLMISEKIYDSLQDMHNLSTNICYQGIEYQQTGDYPSAAAAYLRALKIAEDSHNPEIGGMIKNRLATVFIALGDYEKGFQYATDAYESGLHTNNYRRMATALINLGNSRNYTGNFNTAGMYYDQALKLGQQANDTLLILAALSSNAKVYSDQLQHQQALEAYQKAMQLWPVPDPDNQLTLFLGYAKALYRNNRYREASKYLERSIGLARQYHSGDKLRQAYLLASDNQAAQQNYKQAFQLRQAYEKLNDSLTGEHAIQKVQQLEMQYQTEKKDRDIAEKKLLLAKKDILLQQKNKWLSIFFSGLILLVIAGYFTWYRLRQKHYLQQQQLQTLKVEKTVAVLEAMIAGEEKERKRLSKELHDGVGGLLSAIKMHASALRNEHASLKFSNSLDHILNMMDDAATEVRKTAHNLMPDNLIRSGLAQSLDLFCKSVSHSQQLPIHFYTVGKIQRFKSNFELCTYRIVQELINNIIKHARATEAMVQLTQHNQFLTITVEDNGIGFEHPSVHHKGIGLSNLEERIQSLNGELSITTIPGSGTTVYIEFNISIMQMRDLQTTY